MATADRNNNGEAMDSVVHFSKDGITAFCGNINFSILTDGSFEQGEYTCKNCKRLINGSKALKTLMSLRAAAMLSKSTGIPIDAELVILNINSIFKVI